MARPYSFDEQLRCLRREIAMRKRVYNKRVGEGKMEPEDARWEIECMEAVLATVTEASGQNLL